ncbi:MAG: von Willebrand factor type A domain-containing protein [Bacteroidota bacterium]
MRYLKLFLFLLLATGLHAQSDCVSGTVVDEDSNPLIGVSIIIKGTAAGTVTDLDGKFQLCQLVPGNPVPLEFRYVGYNQHEQTFQPGDSSIVVVMAPSAQTLEEVVVVGYGVQRRRDVTRSVGAISPSRTRKQRNQPEPTNREQYNKITPNGFVKTKKENTSTLSTDVDRAAYANVRRFLKNGQLPPADAVRTEELINYFAYDDAPPKSKDDIALRTEIGPCPWNGKHRLLRVSAKTMPIATEDIPASNLVFLLDVSGSMGTADKLPLVKESLSLLTNSLRPQDKVAIVVYAGAAGVVLEPTSDKHAILNALNRLSSGGSTAGGRGIELAYKLAGKHFVEGGNNRVILATDGDFNVGTSSQEGLIELIEAKRKSGIFLTVLGFGTGNYQDGKMQELADRGNGNHAYIDGAAEARKVLVEEFGGTLFTVAKDVKLQLEFKPGAVAQYRLIGYENRLLNKEDFDDDKKDAAEMGAGHNVTVLYEIVPGPAFAELPYYGYLRLRYKPAKGGRSQKLAIPVAAEHRAGKDASADLRWAAAVTEFAMLLRGSKHKGTSNWAECRKLASGAIGADPGGYRRDFLELLSLAEGLAAKR